MKRMLSRSYLLGLPCLLLSVSVAQSDFCRNNLSPTNPDAVYIDHDNGTVTDTRTGLMWKQCAEGQSGASCSIGAALQFSWSGALNHAKSSDFAGYDDWRLPNVKELSSLVEECRWVPAINTNRFPNSPSWYFWSGSPYAPDSNHTWYVYFFSGDANFWRSYDFHVRLVRGGL